jgi:hypothetical protein
LNIQYQFSHAREDFLPCSIVSPGKNETTPFFVLPTNSAYGFAVNKMYLFSILTKYFPFIASPSIYPLSQIHLGNGVITKPIQGLPSSSLELPSVTALATMPCTSFPGRLAYGNTTIYTFESQFQQTSALLPPSRPTRRAATLTYDVDL